MKTIDYLEEIKREFPNLEEGCENDEGWWNEGIEYLKNKKYKNAEIKFKMLTQSQPNHHDGFEGLAFLYYETSDCEKSIWFMEEAVRIARRFLDDGSIDIEVINEMEENLQAIRNNRQMVKWWKNIS